MLNLPALSRAIDFNDIKTTETTVKMSLPQEPARRLDDLLLFAMVDSSCRPAEALRAPRLDLDKGQHPPLAGHDVDFPARRAEIARKDLVTSPL